MSVHFDEKMNKDILDNKVKIPDGPDVSIFNPNKHISYKQMILEFYQFREIMGFYRQVFLLFSSAYRIEYF